jgi:hypothetical protein
VLAIEEDAETRKLAAEVARLRSRLVAIEDDYDAGRIDGKRFAIATEKARAALATAEVALARGNAGRGAAVMVHSADPVAAFDAAPLVLQRAVVWFVLGQPKNNLAAKVRGALKYHIKGSVVDVTMSSTKTSSPLTWSGATWKSAPSKTSWSNRRRPAATPRRPSHGLRSGSRATYKARVKSQPAP